MPGTLYAGTSGFSYRSWSPSFYPADARPSELLRSYAARLNACELNNTYYQQPSPERIAGWVEATPPTFRFAVKAHRNAARRAFRDDPGAIFEWLLPPFRALGTRLGTVLLRVAREEPRDLRRLDRLLAAWPRDLPLTLELQHPSWLDDAVVTRLSRAGACLCATDAGLAPDSGIDPDPPQLFATAQFLYIRLRRDHYPPQEVARWAARVHPFLEDGRDCYVFFRHDEAGAAPLRALGLARLAELGAREGATSGGP